VKRVISIIEPEDLPACWCFCGPSGRGETLTRLEPELVVILDGELDPERSLNVYQRVSDALVGCGYLPAADLPFEKSFFAASVTEWKRRYESWIADPILQETYRARRLFDLRPIHGQQSLWREVEAGVRAQMNSDFLYLLANDCLDSLPPLTFFQDAVISDSGERSAFCLVQCLRFCGCRPRFEFRLERFWAAHP
jgi:CBS domain-containing protein